MKNEFKKIMKMSSELLSYCHLRGASEFHLDISQIEGAAVIDIKAFPANVTDEEMALLQKKINAPRTREIEHEFWSLSGKSANTSELMLVGMMTDEASVEYKDQTLSIELKRLV